MICFFAGSNRCRASLSLPLEVMSIIQGKMTVYQPPFGKGRWACRRGKLGGIASLNERSEKPSV